MLTTLNTSDKVITTETTMVPTTEDADTFDSDVSPVNVYIKKY